MQRKGPTSRAHARSSVRATPSPSRCPQLTPLQHAPGRGYIFRLRASRERGRRSDRICRPDPSRCRRRRTKPRRTFDSATSFQHVCKTNPFYRERRTDANPGHANHAFRCQPDSTTTRLIAAERGLRHWKRQQRRRVTSTGCWPREEEKGVFAEEYHACRRAAG